MTNLLTPLAILVLAATQIPAWQNAASEVRCRESMKASILAYGDGDHYSDDSAHNGAHHTCRGGDKYAEAILELP